MTNRETIPLSQCEKGWLYRVHSRNLSIAVFDGEDVFIGIRLKFRDRFLDSEIHYEVCNHGTCSPYEKLIKLPEGIEIVSYFPGSYDSHTGRDMEFDKPASKGGNGWTWKDTGEKCEGLYCPTIRHNKALFDWLEEKEEEFGED